MLSQGTKKIVKVNDLRKALQSQVCITSTGGVVIKKSESKLADFFKRFFRSGNADN